MKKLLATSAIATVIATLAFGANAQTVPATPTTPITPVAVTTGTGTGTGTTTPLIKKKIIGGTVVAGVNVDNQIGGDDNEAEGGEGGEGGEGNDD